MISKIKKFLHDRLKWGFPLKMVGGDGFQQNYSCKFCDKEITQDSQGNWFHYEDF